MSSVGTRRTPEAVAFYDSGKPSSFTRAGYIDEIPNLKVFQRYLLSYGIVAGLVHGEFLEHIIRACAALVKVPCKGAIDPFGIFLRETELEGIIPLFFPRLNLNDCTGACFDDRDGNNVATCTEDLCHTEFASDDTL